MACTAPVLLVLLVCPTSSMETPAASTSCHDPAPPEYDGAPSNEGILECPEHACTSRRLPQPRRFFSLPAALPAGTARVPPRRPMRRPDRRLQTATMPRHSSRRRRRSEEHTSELQSLMRNSYAVVCLKKKTQQSNPQKHKIS